MNSFHFLNCEIHHSFSSNAIFTTPIMTDNHIHTNTDVYQLSRLFTTIFWCSIDKIPCKKNQIRSKDALALQNFVSILILRNGKKIMSIRHRLSVTACRSIGFLLNANPNKQHVSSKLSSACRYSTATLIRSPDYVMRYKLNGTPIVKSMGSSYSSDANQIIIPIVTYEEVKDIPNHPEKWLIDVREPDELNETGIIPTAINIPRKNA